jgi:excisionase family DNA binding protein
MTDTSRLMTPADAAAKLGVTRRWLLEQAAAGRIPSVKLAARLVRFDPADLDRYAESRRRTPPPRSEA